MFQALRCMVALVVLAVFGLLAVAPTDAAVIRLGGIRRAGLAIRRPIVVAPLRQRLIVQRVYQQPIQQVQQLQQDYCQQPAVQQIQVRRVQQQNYCPQN